MFDTTPHSFLSGIRYGVMTPKRPALRMTCRIDDTDPERRRGYLSLLYRNRRYQNMSRKMKTAFRRALMNKEVPSV